MFESIAFLSLLRPILAALADLAAPAASAAFAAVLKFAATFFRFNAFIFWATPRNPAAAAL